jgi:SAM-dependent methyltransferase
MSLFADSRASHEHSLEVLNQLQEYDEFMESIQTVIDLGCGAGLDIEWWATRTTREDNPKPLNIKCTGVDVLPELGMAKKYPYITYQKTNFEDLTHIKGLKKYDVLWSHDSFQYALDPLKTLKNWWHLANDGAMLVLIVPQTTNMRYNKLSFTQESCSYHHYTLVNLIHMLAVNGWDCRTGFFLKRPQDPWIHAIVYKSTYEPMDPTTTSWVDLSEKELLPTSADKSIYAHDDLHQQDLILPWIDHSLSDLRQQ